MDTDGRRLRYQHRRPELLDAVVDYVLAHGVSGLAMRPLAAAVGVSHGTLLHHFGSKENLVTEVIDVLRQRLSEAAGSTSEPARLADLTDWWRRSTTEERLPVYRLLFEVFAHAVREPAQYERFLRQVVHDSLALMENLLIADGCAPERAPLVASIVVAQARGLQLDLLATGDRERVDAAFALFVDLIDRI
ncbi:TetR/AcrR family transcriptional regulator [Actinokineospora fastidiosa]|uniref:TetR/AcrR family transcriptional regulator n=1 Tax=Actinokineospora fastidiosa TaxID=1816 RepID=UPI001E483456|nr:TetR/AcrR family transcriptional regulator [Actinokineospora fastidiosa]